MLKYRLIDYFDVWGNQKDGWQVNGVCEEFTSELPDDFTHGDILKDLKQQGFLKKHVRTNMLDFYPLGFEMLEISARRNGAPLCRIEFIEE